MNAAHYDVVVVGARCAGAATALLLARRGLRVALVDRAAPGTDSACTHALMRPGVTQLHRWGVLDRVVDAGTPPVRRTVFRYGNAASTVTLKPIAGVDALYAPRRAVLERILLRAATDAGADVIFGASVSGVERARDGRVIGIVGHNGHGGPFGIRADFTVGADGLHSTIARAVAAPLTRESSSASSSVYGYFDGLGTSGYEWFYAPGASAAVIPTNDDQACVSVSAPPARLDAGAARLDAADAATSADADMLRGFHQLLAEVSRELAERVAAAPPPQRLHRFGAVAGYVRRPWGPGWALVGDAGYYTDPITGHGVSNALRDAELLANAIETSYADNASEQDALRAYHATRDRLSRHLFGMTEAIASFDWDALSVEHHVLAFTAAMVDEVEHLLRLDVAGPPAVPHV